MKKIITSVLMLAMCMGTAVHAEEEVPVKLIVDDKVISTEPLIVNDRTLVPLRALMESTGAEVEWYDETRAIEVVRNDETVGLQIENYIMNTPEGEVTLEAAPVICSGDITYVPLRAICEAFDFEVDWDGGTRTILVNAPDGCAYVDLYDGMTVEGHVNYVGMTPEELTEQTGIEYDDCKDMLYVQFENTLPLSSMAKMYGLSADEAKEMLGLDASTSDNEEWGKILGNMTLREYFGQYDADPDEMLGMFKSAYDLGDEYTLDTKYKYVRTIVENKELEWRLEEKRITEEENAEKAAHEAMLPELCENKKYFTITMADGSVMKGEIYPDVAPATAENFIKLCEEKFYDGLIFHRVIDGFMIQGGGYDKDFNEKEAESIKGEFYANGFINALKHERGVISMARMGGDMDSASSQFFIMDEAAPYLDGQYAAFGRITEGFDVLDKISEVKTGTNSLGMADVPEDAVVIKSIRIESN